ncbi:hypothetical protein ACFLFF_18045 [Brevibacillus reuszeri]|uniref:hypothetical protein n=1 Tax=Brevibacillus reuszeri TaxID=54915 RepID=UPI00366D97C7
MLTNTRLSQITRFFFEKDHKYLLLIPLFVYPIGFIYTLGLFTIFDGGTLNFLNINLGFFPISFNYYLINGIYYTAVFLLLPGSIGVIFARIIVNNTAAFYDKKIKRTLVKLRAFNRNKSYICFCSLLRMCTLIAFFLPIFSIFFCNNLFFNDVVSFNKSSQFIVNFVLFFSIGVSFFSLNAFIISNNIISTIYIYALFISQTFFVLFIGIFSHGVLTTYKAITDNSSDNRELKYAQIFYDENKKASYIKMEINSDVFIGFNVRTQKIDVVPIDKILRIETFNKSPEQKHRQFDEVISFAKHDKKILETVRDYYLFRLNKNMADSRKWINTFTKTYYQNEINLMSPEVIEKAWEKTQTYNSIAVDDFLGYDTSIPISTGDMKFNVYVIEYWKNDTIYLLMQMTKENGIWKINKLNTIQSFRFYK